MKRSEVEVVVGVVLLVVGLIFAFNGYYIYTHPLEGIGFWELFFGSREYLESKVRLAQGAGGAMIAVGIVLVVAAGVLLMRGLEHEPRTIFCRYCGTENDGDAIFCRKCGKKF